MSWILKFHQYGETSWFDLTTVTGCILEEAWINIHLIKNDTYMSGINYDDPTFEERISKYIGIFMLSRIDGEAKAKYIKKEEDKENVRDIARKFILGKIVLEEKVGDYPRGVIEINS